MSTEISNEKAIKALGITVSNQQTTETKIENIAGYDDSGDIQLVYTSDRNVLNPYDLEEGVADVERNQDLEADSIADNDLILWANSGEDDTTEQELDEKLYETLQDEELYEQVERGDTVLATGTIAPNGLNSLAYGNGSEVQIAYGEEIEEFENLLEPVTDGTVQEPEDLVNDYMPEQTLEEYVNEMK